MGDNIMQQLMVVILRRRGGGYSNVDLRKNITGPRNREQNSESLRQMRYYTSDVLEHGERA